MPTDPSVPGLGAAPAVGPTGLVESLVDRGRRWWRPGPLLAAVGDTGGRGVHLYSRRQDRPDRGWDRGPAVGAEATGPAALVTTPAGAVSLVPSGAGPSDAAIVPWELSGSAGWLAGVPLPGAAVSAARAGRDVLAAVAEPSGVTLWLRRSGWLQVGHAPGASDGVLAGGRRGLTALLTEGDDLRWGDWRPGGWYARGTLGAAGTATPALVATGSGWLAAVPRGGTVETTWIDRRGRTRRGAPIAAGLVAVRGVALAVSGRVLWALTDEGGSVYAHRYDAAGRRWLRSACLRLLDPERFTVDQASSTKLAQVSGEHDSQPHPDGFRPTLSRSVTTSGVLGTDLGVRVDHDGRTFLFFGDTHWHGRPWLGTRDAIAEVVGDDGEALPRVVFHGSPLKVRGGRVTMREYDVPLGAVSHGGELYGFFTSNHFRGGQTMGRSVLARAADPALRIDPAARRRPLVFDYVATVSDQHFINVSVQPFPAADLPGIEADGDVWLLFGSGAYRAGDLMLAVIDPNADGVADALGSRRPVPWRALRPRYSAGADAAGLPRWADDEADAVALLAGAYGEISVRWVPEVGRFLLLAGNGPEDPIGPSVVLRSAPTPWGPWSPRHRLFDWVAGGMSFADPGARFIKALGDGTDPVGDRVFRAQRDGTGAAYAPYLYDARREGDTLVLRYTLSTWNPYQVVLMEHRLSVAVLDTSSPAPAG